LEFIKTFLSGSKDVDIEAIQAENHELKQKVEDLESKLAELKKEQVPVTEVAE
jgi:cell division septum initiation protein DivIVA